MLTEQCARSACKDITTDPVADVGTVARKLVAGSVSGRVYDATGKAGTATSPRASSSSSR